MVMQENTNSAETLTTQAFDSAEFMCEECGNRFDKLKNLCGVGICEACYLKLL